MRKYDAVLFDLDGTVLDTLPDLTASVNFALNGQGRKARSETEIRGFLGNGIRRLFELAAADADEREREALIAAFRGHYFDHCRDKTKPYPGVGATLAALKEEGIDVGLVTNKVHEAASVLAERFFPGVFAVVEGQREGIPRKPNPTMANRALTALGVPAERCLYVGDSEVDAATAANVGCDFAAVSWGYRDRAVLAALEPSFLADDTASLTDWILSRED